MDQVSEVREKIDIVALISEYLTLKKAGRNFKAVCPFHNEKTPSFVVSPERQIWHCFGCSKGGDCFTFLMEYENLEFPEALRILAKKAGVELKDFSFNKGAQSKKEKIFNLNDKANKFYSYLLTNHSIGKKALSYLLEKRKIPKSLISSFEIGFSPSLGSSLSDFLIKKGLKKEDLKEAGLSFEIRGKTVDFFKGRLMFPLKDHRGNIVGFSARYLDENPPAGKGPKYINTKETQAYHKGELFFGLDRAKEEIKKQNQAIIVEGEFDVISLVKEGIKNVVAIKGTALTENQVMLLSRFCSKVTLCLDQDEAGFEAMKRSLLFLERRGLTTTVIMLKNAKDPDEAIKKNPLLFKKALKEDVGVYDYLIEKIVLENDKQKIEGKKKITDELLPLISQISNEIVKEHYLKLLSSKIDVSIDSLQKQLNKVQAGIKEDEIKVIRKDKKKRREILEEYLLAIIIQHENAKKLYLKAKDELKTYEFEVLSIKKIMDQLGIYFKNLNEFDQKKFAKALPKELVQFFDACYIFPLFTDTALEKHEEEVEKVVEELNIIFAKQKIQELSKLIKEAKQEDKKELEKKLAEFIKKIPKNS